MRRTTFLPLLALAAAACAAPPVAPGPSATHAALSPRACIDQNAATHWVPINENTILVRSGPRSFRVSTNTCQSLRDPLVRITRVLPGGSRICGRQDVRLYLSDGGNIPTPCFVQGIEPLSEEQARALETSGR